MLFRGQDTSFRGCLSAKQTQANIRIHATRRGEHGCDRPGARHPMGGWGGKLLPIGISQA